MSDDGESGLGMLTAEGGLLSAVSDEGDALRVVGDAIGCDGRVVGDLLDHEGGLAVTFGCLGPAAVKQSRRLSGGTQGCGVENSLAEHRVEGPWMGVRHGQGDDEGPTFFQSPWTRFAMCTGL